MRAALVVLDGWGLREARSASTRSSGEREDERSESSERGAGEARERSDPRDEDDPDVRDAVRAADTPTFDRLREAGAYGTLETHGRRVGLPEGQMGNSEVGHLNIGAGRVVTQDSTRVTDATDTGGFFENETLNSAFDHAADHDGTVHFVGLVSDGGVHSYQAHLHALIEFAADRGVPAVTHAFTDGRDTAPKSGAGYLAELQGVVDREGTGDVATVTGRYYAMDRDRNWDRTKRAYDVITRSVIGHQTESDDAIVDREAPHEAPDAVTAVEQSYDRGDTDEYVEPTLVAGGRALQDGDSVVFFNFRADRARQLTRMLADIEPEWEFETDPPDAMVATLTEYDRTFDLPVAFPPNQPEDVLGEVLSAAGLTQLRIAESEKYAHVTYFLNGGREVEFDGELRRIVDSPDVPTYDQQPEMSAPEVTDTAISVIRSDDPDVLVLNYANPDMVGHTGDFEAAVAAVEAVDEQLGRLVEAVRAAGGHVLVTADHGNADDMGTEEDPHTAHTTNPVPFVYLDPEGTDGGKRVREGGTLADVAPTLLSLVGVEQPAAMTGESLLE